MNTDFYFDRVVRPGQAGIIRISIKTGDKLGRNQYDFELATNDPRQPVLKVSLIAMVNALPSYIRRFDNAELALGEQVDTFKIWPTAHPRFTVDRGESVAVSLRVRPGQSLYGANATRTDANSTESRAVKSTPDPGQTSNWAREKPLPADKLNYVARSGAAAGTYWIDLKIGAINEPGVYTWSVVLPAETKELAGLPLEVTLHVLDDNMIVTPSSLDLGEVSAATLNEAGNQIGRFGIRKLVGSFHVKSVSSSLPFLNPQPQNIIEGTNYLFLVMTTGAKVPSPGSYTGTLQVDTDDPKYSKLEVPFKVTVKP